MDLAKQVFDDAAALNRVAAGQVPPTPYAEEDERLELAKRASDAETERRERKAQATSRECKTQAASMDGGFQRPYEQALAELNKLRGELFNEREKVRGLSSALRMALRALDLFEAPDAGEPLADLDFARDVLKHPAEYNRCADCDYPLHCSLGRISRCPSCGEKWEWGAAQ